jgi:hypothetical protein
MPVKKLQLLKLFWDRAAAVLCVVVAVVVLVSGWISLSAEAEAGDQIPYIMSGGIGGLFLLVIGATLWVSSDLRDEWRKLDALDQSVRQLSQEAEVITLPDPKSEHESPPQDLVRQP